MDSTFAHVNRSKEHNQTYIFCLLNSICDLFTQPTLQFDDLSSTNAVNHRFLKPTYKTSSDLLQGIKMTYRNSMPRI